MHLTHDCFYFLWYHTRISFLSTLVKEQIQLQILFLNQNKSYIKLLLLKKINKAYPYNLTTVWWGTWLRQIYVQVKFNSICTTKLLTRNHCNTCISKCNVLWGMKENTKMRLKYTSTIQIANCQTNKKISTCGATMILKDCWSFSANPKATNGKMS